jgi:hypothetical protein
MEKDMNNMRQRAPLSLTLVQRSRGRTLKDISHADGAPPQETLAGHYYLLWTPIVVTKNHCSVSHVLNALSPPPVEPPEVS